MAYCSKEAHSCVEKAAMIGFVKMRILEPDETCSLRGQTVREVMVHPVMNILNSYAKNSTQVCSKSYSSISKYFSTQNCRQWKLIWKTVCIHSLYPLHLVRLDVAHLITWQKLVSQASFINFFNGLLIYKKKYRKVLWANMNDILYIFQAQFVKNLECGCTLMQHMLETLSFVPKIAIWWKALR